MIKFISKWQDEIRPSQFEIDTLTDWISKDPYHKDNTVDWWLDSDGIISCWVYDDKGPVMFLFAEDEDDLVRLHIQFAPVEEIGKLRMAKALIDLKPRFVEVMKSVDKKGIAFKSINPSLIKFMNRLGFEDWKEDDYLLKF